MGKGPISTVPTLTDNFTRTRIALVSKQMLQEVLSSGLWRPAFCYIGRPTKVSEKPPFHIQGRRVTQPNDTDSKLLVYQTVKLQATFQKKVTFTVTTVTIAVLQMSRSFVSEYRCESITNGSVRINNVSQESYMQEAHSDGTLRNSSHDINVPILITSTNIFVTTVKNVCLLIHISFPARNEVRYFRRKRSQHCHFNAFHT
jgi:hypothetical protein